MSNPCFDCQKRHTLCWSDCEDYKAWKKEHDELSEKIRRAREEDGTKLKRRRWNR